MRFLLSLTISLFVGLASLPTYAQPAGAMGDDFIYLVKPGDTLSELSKLYALGPAQWRKIKELNKVADEHALSIGKALKIPFSMIPVVATEAKLVHSKGQVWVNDNNATPMQSLHTGDMIRTGHNGFATLQLDDLSTLTLPNNSQLTFKQLNAFERARLTDAIIELNQGSLESRVAPENQGVGRFEIHTPQSVTGVRGTSLRVHTQDQHTQTELLTGKAMLNTEQAMYQSLQKEHGASVAADGSYTINQLLAAPILGEPARGKQGWETQIHADPAADHYLVHITLDEYGADITQSYTVAANQDQVPLRSSGSGVRYAFIRAVDINGLMGLDASVSFLGQNSVVSSDGMAVLSSDGAPILLTEY